MRNLPRVALAAILCALAGCRASAPVVGVPARPRPAAVADRVDALAQQRAYGEGVEFFSAERYAEAHRAWMAANLLGPGTALGARARKHLANVDSILKGLHEIERE